MRRICDEENIEVGARAVNQYGEEQIRNGTALPKDLDIKPKTLDDADVLLGADPDNLGLATHYRPDPPDPGRLTPEQFQRANARWEARVEQFNQLEPKMQQMVADERITIDPVSGLVRDFSSVPRSGVTGGEAVSAGGPTTDHAPHAGGRKRPPHHPSRRSDERGGGRRWSQRAWTYWSCSASRHRELTSISCAKRWPCSPRRSWTARSRRRSAPATASAARCAPPGATATGRDAGTREWAASTCRSRSSARGATSRRYSSPGAAPSAPCWPSCNKRTWRGSPHAASTTSCARSAARASRRASLAYLLGARHGRHELPRPAPRLRPLPLPLARRAHLAVDPTNVVYRREAGATPPMPPCGRRAL